MKKFLLSIALLTSGFASFAQVVPLNKDWLLKIGSSNLITSHVANGNPSVAYNSGTDKVYLSDWNNKISILNTDGTLASPSTLTTDPSWSSDGAKYMKVRVAADGAIYATNRVLSAGNLVVYRWASQTDASPTRTLIAVPNRSGESFAVFGSGDNTKLYIGGATTTAITVASVVGGVITKNFDITVSANHARGSISAETASTLWLNTPNSGAGFETRRITINPATGAILSTDVIPGASIDWAYANTEYFADGTKKYLAVSGAVIGGTPAASNIGLKMRIYDITTLAAPSFRSEGDMFPYVSGVDPIASSNANGYGDVTFKKNLDGSHTFFHVVFGSGLASYTTLGTLPVSLTSFEAAFVKGQSTLTWATASETNSKGFEVLRSTDGKEFTKIDFVKSKGTDGNSATALSYTYVDRSAKAGENYYKLQQVDLNGTSELFEKVVSVNVSLSGAEVLAFPNPATTYVTISTGGEDYKGFKYELFDASGKKVLSEKAKAAQQDISLSNLATSIYYLKVSKNSVEQKTIKVIKQ